MNSLLKPFVILLLAISFGSAHAQSTEAPPREPPYVDDNEFDPVQSEDPAASNEPAPTPAFEDPIPSPAQQSADPVVEQAPRPSNRAARPAYSSGDSATTYKPGTTPEKGVKLLHHPDAKKGLIRIEQDGTYVYKVSTKKSNQTGIVRIGMMEPPKILAADGIHNFASMYGESGLPMVMAEYEWQPFSSFGKLGVQAGVGFATAEAKGYFAEGGTTPDERSEESYQFFAVPITLGVIYRFEYFKRQWLAPYASGGASYIGVAELRDDDKNHFSGTPGAYGAGGIMFNISALDRNLAFDLSNQYGVANLWIIGEYRYQYAFSEELDFSGGIFSVGVGADF
ncbi:MAG: hypothetical protein H7326_10935 [Bdellovibrionaceae bacterium]|nr:hypothetical protein [Pseudobdellovibrionaceae bacterium]